MTLFSFALLLILELVILCGAVDPLGLISQLVETSVFRSPIEEDDSFKHECTRVFKITDNECKEICILPQVAEYGVRRMKVTKGTCAGIGYNQLVRSYFRKSMHGSVSSETSVDVYRKAEGNYDDSAQLEEMVDGLINSMEKQVRSSRFGSFGGMLPQFSPMFSSSRFLERPSLGLTIDADDDDDSMQFIGPLPFLSTSHHMAMAEPTVIAIQMVESDEDDEPYAVSNQITQEPSSKIQLPPLPKVQPENIAKTTKQSKAKEEIWLEQEEKREVDGKEKQERKENQKSMLDNMHKEWAGKKDSASEAEHVVRSLPKIEDYENIVIPKSLKEKLEKAKNNASEASEMAKPASEALVPLNRITEM